MSEVLSRNFVAVDCQGNEFRITDIVQLIRDYGFDLFLRTFAFSHGKIIEVTRYLGYQLQRDENGELRSKELTKRKLQSEFKYIIKDVYGKQYSSDYLISLFCEKFPKEAAKMWFKLVCPHYRYNNGRWTRYGYSKKWQGLSYDTIPFKKGLWQANKTLLEEGVKPVRKLKEFYECPYDDPYYRSYQRNWKKYRKTQYKIST